MKLPLATQGELGLSLVGQPPRRGVRAPELSWQDEGESGDFAQSYGRRQTEGATHLDGQVGAV